MIALVRKLPIFSIFKSPKPLLSPINKSAVWILFLHLLDKALIKNTIIFFISLSQWIVFYAFLFLNINMIVQSSRESFPPFTNVDKEFQKTKNEQNICIYVTELWLHRPVVQNALKFLHGLWTNNVLKICWP